MSISMVTGVHFPSACTGDAGCLLQLCVLGVGVGGWHAALFKALKQETTLPSRLSLGGDSPSLRFQNYTGEGNEAHPAHTHLPGPAGDAGQSPSAELTLAAQGARPVPATPSSARDPLSQGHQPSKRPFSSLYLSLFPIDIFHLYIRDSQMVKW